MRWQGAEEGDRTSLHCGSGASDQGRNAPSHSEDWTFSTLPQKNKVALATFE